MPIRRRPRSVSRREDSAILEILEDTLRALGARDSAKRRAKLDRQIERRFEGIDFSKPGAIEELVARDKADEKRQRKKALRKQRRAAEPVTRPAVRPADVTELPPASDKPSTPHRGVRRSRFTPKPYLYDHDD